VASTRSITRGSADYIRDGRLFKGNLSGGNYAGIKLAPKGSRLLDRQRVEHRMVVLNDLCRSWRWIACPGRLAPLSVGNARRSLRGGEELVHVRTHNRGVIGAAWNFLEEEWHGHLK
jgi:hypothetical protein